ncbi:ABC transporter ATP-binding protein [Stenotrophomonas rhizophila]|uniref:ABC transporter ATP-binding protein n=1 Tax=Stenotrophomonas rhizophila TaxID=216778 RepID=UPI0028AC23D1|nr:ABC transporter ATP-binding protein [Stenotrophomonas rhizophila]
MDEAVWVEDLYKDFPGHPSALAGVSLTVRQSQSVAIVGPNGSGKSTLFKSIVGLIEPTAGRVRLLGQPLTEAGRRGLDRTGIVLEGRANLYDRLSIQENCDYACRLRGKRVDRPYMQAVADQLGLGALQRPVRRLSTGNRQRAALLCALAHRPDLIMLDEPTLGLDVEGTLALETLLKNEQRRGASIITISHDAGFVAATAERVVGMQAGRWAFERTGTTAATAVERFRLAVEATYPLPTSVTASLVREDTFAGQLSQLQALARIYPDLRHASITAVARTLDASVDSPVGEDEETA